MIRRKLENSLWYVQIPQHTAKPRRCLNSNRPVTQSSEKGDNSNHTQRRNSNSVGSPKEIQCLKTCLTQNQPNNDLCESLYVQISNNDEFEIGMVDDTRGLLCKQFPLIDVDGC